MRVLGDFIVRPDSRSQHNKVSLQRLARAQLNALNGTVPAEALHSCLQFKVDAILLVQILEGLPHFRS